MSVYIEVVLLDNFLMTFLAAAASYKFLSLRGGRLRRIFASVLGTGAAVCYPFLNIHALLLLAFKLVLCLGLSLILFYKRCNLLKGAGTFLLITFFFGGVIFAVSLMICGDPVRALTEPVANVPPSLFVSAAVIGYALVKNGVKRLKKIFDASRFTYDVEVSLLSKKVKLKGFLDTGNRLYDTKSSLPIIILSARACIELLDGDSLRYAIEKKGEKISSDAHYIDYTTLNSKNSRMLVLKPDAIVLYSDKCEHTIKDIAVGLSFFGFSDALDYDVILHPALIKQL